MMKILSKRERVERIEYRLEFEWEDMPGAGYTFPCDAHGNVLGDWCRAKAEREQQVREAHATEGLKFLGVQTHTRWVINYAVGRCTCGRKVTLSDPLYNECDCGLWWNMCGQQKIDPTSALGRALDDEEGERYGVTY